MSVIHYDDWSGFLETSDSKREKEGKQRGRKESHASGKFHLSYFFILFEENYSVTDK